jgi:trans-2-enoyl-CoA reductase
MKSIYVISEEARNLASFLEDGELSQEMETALAINQIELQEKAINYGYVVKSFEGDVSLISEEIKRLTAIKKAKESAIDRMKDAVLSAMQIYSIEKVSSPTLNMSIRRTESIEVPLVELLDSKFVTEKIVKSADKIAIKKAIKDGEIIEGAFIQSNYNLQIK